MKRLRLLTIFIAGLLILAAGCSSTSTGSKEDEINLMFVSHTFVDAIKPLIPEFEKETGLKVNYEVLAEEPAFEKLLADLSSGTGEYDLFMTSPLKNWQYISAGWVEPLDSYVEKAPESWEFNDFIPGIVDSGRWTKEPLHGVGEGELWALPINYESYNLSYRPSLLEKYNLKVPETYEELSEMITELNGKELTDDEGKTVFPIVTRFNKYWDLTYLTFGTMLQSYGVELINENNEVAIDSPQSIEATELFVKMLKEGSPDGAGLFSWYEALQGFTSGQYIFSLNEADSFASTYENDKESAVHDDVGYAMIPMGPDNVRNSSIWVWSLAMNSASQNKDGAWKFLEWVTSKDIMIDTHLAGNMNPVRSSAWDNEEVSAMVKQWGAEEGQYLSVLEETSQITKLQLNPHPQIARALDIWAEAVQKSYYGEATVEDSLKQAAEQIEKVLLDE